MLYLAEKGYGFISRPDGEDLFVHYSQIHGNGYLSLNECDRVQFEITEGRKGLQASNVIVINQ